MHIIRFHISEGFSNNFVPWIVVMTSVYMTSTQYTIHTSPILLSIYMWRPTSIRTLSSRSRGKLHNYSSDYRSGNMTNDYL